MGKVISVMAVWLLFRGTRGEIAGRTRRHLRHTSTLVRRSGYPSVLIDWGADWMDVPWRRPPAVILLTHAHADHVGGLVRGAPCPVYATAETWDVIGHWDIRQRAALPLHTRVQLAGLGVEAIPVTHSIRAPAVGFRLSAGGTTIFYVPDVAAIPRLRKALGGVHVYVGDGASIDRSILRHRDGVPIGHASIRTQLEWCRQVGIPHAIFTHCGSAIVGGQEREAEARVRQLGGDDLRVDVAYDGWRCRVPQIHGRTRTEAPHRTSQVRNVLNGPGLIRGSGE